MSTIVWTSVSVLIFTLVVGVGIYLVDRTGDR